MKPVQYVKGDATAPRSSGNKIIVHVCNDIGGWGKGFVMALSSKWPAPEKEYREWYQSQQNFALGEVQFIQVENDLWVANVIGQRKVVKDEQGNPPIRYEAVAKGLAKVASFALEIEASIHMPRIGCGLAGGSWEQMEPIIIQVLSEKRIEVTVYDF